ncbi:MAG: GHKL domain-containing protein [Desulfobacterales bacterium]|nr:GHKL domain-containing protein [Desulfobacterales bacterium]MBF0398544.1 GHKL domain-containing protein [Desulfobacterales bacterium]
MKVSIKQYKDDLGKKLKWLIIFRIIFTTILLGSTIFIQFQLHDDLSPLAKSLLALYALIVIIFYLSIIYAFILPYIKNGIIFAYIQIISDTFIVTLIIFCTGGFGSIFSFLYLVVIMYSSLLLFRKGSIIMASICSIQYGVMIDLEYYKIIIPFGIEENILALSYDWVFILYRIIMLIMACFAVALLSGFLSEQIKRTRKELLVMEEQVKRVEKVAVIGEMAASMAHEIKNPLASLIGAIQILKEELPPNAHQDKLMAIINREAERLNMLLTNFLFFTKPVTSSIKAIDLAKVIDEIVSLFEKDKCCRDRITISTKFNPNIFVEMDQSHLCQVMWNLLINSAEAIKDKGIISIDIYKTKRGYACIRISDNGCGISEKDLNSIFDPFFTTKSKGTGLGLSIVNRILESYDGELDVESKIGIGTTFTLSLKLINFNIDK